MQLLLPFLVFILFASKTSPYVLGGDNGEFLVNGLLGGLIHPPGYPLYGMSMRLIGLLPFNPIYLGNLTSAFFSCLTLYFLLKLIDKNCWILNSLISMLFCFNPLILQYSTEAEVFSLNALFAVSIYYFLNKFKSEQLKKDFYIGFFLAFLSLTNHFTILFVLVPYAMFFAPTLKKLKWTLNDGLILFGLALLGLSPYLYLFVTSAVPTSFGQITNFSQFSSHVGRDIYSNSSLAGREAKGSSIFAVYLVMFKELGTRWVIIFIPGIMYLNIKKWKTNLAVLASIVFYTFTFFGLVRINFNNPVNYDLVRSYYLLLDILILMLLALSIRDIENKKIKNMTLTCSVLFLLFHGKNMIQQRKPVFEQWAQSTLELLPKNSVLFLNGDHGFGSFYAVQILKNIRRDINLLPFDFLNKPWSPQWFKTHYPNLSLPSKRYYSRRGYSLNEFLQINPGKDFFIQGSIPIRTWDKSLNQSYDILPWGTVSAVRPKGFQKENFKSWINVNRGFFNKIREDNFLPFEKDTWDFAFYYEMAQALNRFSLNILMNSRSFGHGVKFHPTAIESMDRAVSLDVLGNPSLYRNLGMASMEIGKRIEAKEYFKEYLEKINTNHPDQKQIKSLLQKL